MLWHKHTNFKTKYILYKALYIYVQDKQYQFVKYSLQTHT